VSQITRGREIISHRRVRWEGVCVHVDFEFEILGVGEEGGEEDRRM
jgi:hypothetical protein